MSVVSLDQATFGVLVESVSRDAVYEAVAVCGVGERRSDGKLPARVIIYLTLALCPPAVVLPATPASLIPPHHDPIQPVEDIVR